MSGKKASVVSAKSPSSAGGGAQSASYTAPSSNALSRALGMRYAEDLRTLGFLAAYVAITVFMWRHHADQRIPSIVWVALWWLTTWLSFTGAVATHNTIHCKIFNHNLGNAFMRFALTLWYGHPCSTFVPGHNLSHHRYTQMVNDLMQTSVAQYKPNILNLFLFHPRIVSGVMKSDITYMLWMGKKGRRMFHEWLAEGLVLIAVTVTLIVLSPSKWLFYFMAPHYVAQFCIVTINLLQHDGCDIVLPRVDDASPSDGDMYADHMAPPPPDLNKIREENALPESTMMAPIATPLPGAKALTFKERVSTFNTARNFVSPTLNWLLMNNGYHTVHHHRPYLHWSLLPEAHAREVKPHIHPALDQASIWGYMFEQYVYPGVRTDYLGKPVVFDRTMDESACGDWMNMPAADKTTVDSMDTRTRLRFVADGALVVLIKLISPMYSPFAAAD